MFKKTFFSNRFDTADSFLAGHSIGNLIIAGDARKVQGTFSKHSI